MSQKRGAERKKAKEPTPDQKKMIERALKDTVEAITEAAVTSFENHGIKSTVLSTAAQRWNQRYTPMYRHAVVDKGLIWERDKELVIDRARQVGIIASNMATIKAIIFAWIRGEIGKPGQYVHVGNAPKPEITIGMAELASRCVDCLAYEDEDQNNHEDRWDWCSTELAPPLRGLPENISTPPTILEIIKFLTAESFQSEIEIGQRLVAMTERQS